MPKINTEVGKCIVSTTILDNTTTIPDIIKATPVTPNENIIANKVTISANSTAINAIAIGKAMGDANSASITSHKLDIP